MSQHDDQGNQKLHKYPDYFSSSLSRKHLPGVENSATILESQETKRLPQTKLCGFGRPGCCKLNPVGFLTDVPPQEKRAEHLSSRKPMLQTQVSHTLCSSLKASRMAFCCCFQPPSPAFSTADGAPGSLLELALTKGSPGATPLSYLYQQQYCNSSNVFYIQLCGLFPGRSNSMLVYICLDHSNWKECPINAVNSAAPL